MYTICTQYIRNMYAICTQFVRNLFTICTQFLLLRVSETYNKGKPFQNVRFSLKLFPFQAEVRNFLFCFFYSLTVVRCIEKFTWHFIWNLPFVAQHSILFQTEIHSASNITVIYISHTFIPIWLFVYFRSHFCFVYQNYNRFYNKLLCFWSNVLSYRTLINSKRGDFKSVTAHSTTF